MHLSVKKRIKKGLILFEMLIVAFFLSEVSGFADVMSQPQSFSGPDFNIDGLTANLFPNNILVISGKVLNKSHRTASGKIIIHLLNAGHGVINSIEETVNNDIAFSHGEAVPFETTINTEIAPGTQNIRVEFVESKLQSILSESSSRITSPPSSSLLRNKLEQNGRTLPALESSGKLPIQPSVTPPSIELMEKTKKCVLKGGAWVNNQCVISIE